MLAACYGGSTPVGWNKAPWWHGFLSHILQTRQNVVADKTDLTLVRQTEHAATPLLRKKTSQEIKMRCMSRPDGDSVATKLESTLLPPLGCCVYIIGCRLGLHRLDRQAEA